MREEGSLLFGILGKDAIDYYWDLSDDVGTFVLAMKFVNERGYKIKCGNCDGRHYLICEKHGVNTAHEVCAEHGIMRKTLSR